MSMEDAELASGPGEDLRQPSALAPLRERDYRYYFVGNVLSNLGTFCQTIAQSLLVYELTGSTFLVGVVNFAQFIAILVLAPWTGAAADRFDRKQILIVSQIAAGVIAGVLTILSAAGYATAAVVIGAAGLLGITNAFSFPTFRALLPSLVSNRNLGRAMNLDSVSVNLARALGPVGGAAIVAGSGATWAFGINAVSFFVLVLALTQVHPAPQPVVTARVRFRDGVRTVIARPRVAALLVIVACCGVASDPPSTLGPEVAHSFGGGDTLAGVILGCFGAGAVIGAFLAGKEAVRHHRKVAITLAVLVTGTAVFALSPWLGLALAGVVAAGFGYLTSQTRTTTLLYRSIDDHERGRIMALWAVAFIGIRPIASLVDGAIAALAGVRVAALAMALPAAVACVMSIVMDRRDRAVTLAVAR